MLWWVNGDSARLGPVARAIIEDPEHEKIVSDISLWEIALKARIGKLDGDVAAISASINADGFSRMGIATVHLSRLGQLPVFADHKDPFDHLLIAIALAEGSTIMSSDRQFERYGVEVIDPAP